MRRRAAMWGAAGIAVLAGVTAPQASAAVPSFQGKCDFHGMEVLIDQPLAEKHRPVTLDISGPGRCDGEVGGVPRTEAVAQLSMRVSGTSGCFGSTGYLTGPATFRFDDTEIPVAAAVRIDSPGYFYLIFTGDSGGAAGSGLPTGTVPLDTFTGGPKSLLEYDPGCFTGTVCEQLGQNCRTMRRAGFAFDMTTNGVMTARTTPAAAPPAPPKARRAPRLSSVLDVSATRRCRPGSRLVARVAPEWRRKVASVRVTARGRSRSSPRAVSIAGPRGRRLEVTYRVRLKDGRESAGRRVFTCG